MAATSVSVSRSPSPSLYRQLRPRPNGPPRTDIVANQRARVDGAMLEASASVGYSQTSVAQLCRLAGISKRTFYEQFANREACFRASYERIVGSACRVLADAASTATEFDVRLARALDALFQEVAREPKAARLALIEVTSAEPAILVRHDRLRRDIERRIGAFSHSQSLPDPHLLARGIVAGIERVLVEALRTERLDDPCELAAQLTRWMLSYRSLVLPRLASPRPRVELTQCQASRKPRSNSPRARLLRAAAEIVATEGYRRLTLSRIADLASVAEDQLLSLYDTVEACYLDAIDLLVLETLISAMEGARLVEDPVRRAQVGVALVLEEVAGNSLIRGAIYGEARTVGPAAIKRGERLLSGVVEACLGCMPDSSDYPWAAEEATTGALWNVVHSQVQADGGRALPSLSGLVAHLALAPRLGTAFARSAHL